MGIGRLADDEWLDGVRHHGKFDPPALHFGVNPGAVGKRPCQDWVGGWLGDRPLDRALQFPRPMFDTETLVCNLFDDGIRERERDATFREAGVERRDELAHDLADDWTFGGIASKRRKRC